MDGFIFFTNQLSIWTIPVLLLIPLYGMFKKVKVYESFVDGAKEGFTTAIRIIPYLVAMLVAIGVFRASGAMEMLVSGIRPFTKLVGFPAEILPMALMRSLSGGGSQGIMVDMMKTYGPDSFLGNLAGVIMGSSETTLYVLAVYFGSVAIRKSRHAVAVGLMADVVAVIASVAICTFMFT